MRKNIKKFKKGAASFYIVAFSTLILVIIAASFAAIIISEVTRTSNDDLSQSAYDSALAGVEDAKLAFYNYQNCVENGSGDENCMKIQAMMENPDCDMVGKILGRVGEEGGEVIIQESSVGNNMQQAYTCVKVETSLSDYRATLTSNNQTKVARIKFDNVDADAIEKVKVSWSADADSTRYKYTNFDTMNDRVIFPKIVAGATETTYAIATPPTLSVGLIQTADNFTLDQFEMSLGGQTNRGMVYLVPTDDKAAAAKSQEGNYIGACPSADAGGCDNIGSNNFVSRDGVLKTNDKVNKNLPYAVYCPKDAGNEFVCSATIELPKPIGGKRNNDTFMFVVSIPYGQPTTDFALEFYCANGNLCYDTGEAIAEDSEETRKTDKVNLKGVQIKVDSTGRANDLFRRVETRLEGADDFTLSVLGPLELLGDGNGDDLLKKDYAVTTEYNF